MSHGRVPQFPASPDLKMARFSQELDHIHGWYWRGEYHDTYHGGHTKENPETIHEEREKMAESEIPNRPFRYRAFDWANRWFWVVIFYRRAYGQPRLEFKVFGGSQTRRWLHVRAGWEEEPGTLGLIVRSDLPALSEPLYMGDTNGYQD